MSNILNHIYFELMRFLTGKLYTEKQIKTITSHTIGRYFADFFPEGENEKKTRERVEKARNHITKASEISGGIQLELEVQTNQLDGILNDIESKKVQAKKFAELAAINEAQFLAYKEQIAESLKSELIAQSNQGKILRRFVSALMWFLTLIIGATLGTYFNDIVQWFGVVFSS